MASPCLMMVAWVNSESLPAHLDPDTRLLRRAGKRRVSGPTSRCLFTQTMPELIRVATRNARSRSDDQTEPPRPKSVSLARATTSSMSVKRSTGSTGPNCSFAD